jgi:single-strand DNA-binding protein
MNQIVVTGILGADPQIRFLDSGQAMCTFSVADTPRKFNKQTNKWENQDTNWFRCIAWGSLAENVSESFVKGDSVILVGKITTRKWVDREGANRVDQQVVADECGPGLSRATAKQQRAERQPAPRQQQRAHADPFGGGAPAQQYEDPWAQVSGTPVLEDPPF